MTSTTNVSTNVNQEQSANDAGWQDYLAELRMLDEGCPNCELSPQPDPEFTPMVARPRPISRFRLLLRVSQAVVTDAIGVLVETAFGSWLG